MIVIVPSMIQAKGGKLVGGEWRLECPIHGGKNQPLAMTEKGGKALFCCHAGCDSKDLLRALVRDGLLLETDPSGKGGQDRLEKPPYQPWMKRVWEESKPLKGTLAEKYLRSRGLKLPQLPDVRCNIRRSELVARVVGLDGKPTGLHLTKLPEKERKMHGRVKGGAVRLLKSKLPVLALAEGIETALAWSETAFQGRTFNVWACLSANGLQNVEIPEGVKSVIIITDFDGAGITAAERLKKGVLAKGQECRIVLPGGSEKWHKTDFIDMVKKES